MASMFDITKRDADSDNKLDEDPQETVESDAAPDEKQATDNLDELYGRPNIPDFEVSRLNPSNQEQPTPVESAPPSDAENIEEESLDASPGDDLLVEEKTASLISLADFLGKNNAEDELGRDPFAEDVFGPEIDKPSETLEVASEDASSGDDYFFGGNSFGVLDLPGAEREELALVTESTDEIALTNPFQFDTDRYANAGLTLAPDEPYDATPEQNEHIGTLADAVQNALRNVYGPETDGSNDEAFEENSRLTLPAPVSNVAWDRYETSGLADTWQEIDGEVIESKPVSAAELDENTTEAVLSYLYNQDQAPVARSRPAPVHALDGLLDSVERHRRDTPYADEEDAASRADREAPPIAASPYASSSQESPYYRGASLREPLARKLTEEPAAKQPPSFSGEAGPAPERSELRAESGRNPVVAPVVASQQETDSSRMLGAAGLGLIGGIALAGIMSVFVFNSVVNKPDSSRNEASFGSAPQQATRDGGVNSQEKSVARLDTSASGGTQVANLAPAAAPDGSLAALDAYGAVPGAVPLNISVAGRYQSDNVLISVKGVPDDARLSAGIDVGGGTWLLPPQRLNGLQITFQGSQSGAYELEAQVMQSDARTPVSESRRFALTVTGDIRDKISDEAVQTALAALQLSGANRAEPARSEGAPAPARVEEPTASVSQQQPATASEGISREAVEEANSNLRIAALPRPSRASSDPQKSQQFIREGNRLMRDGDIVSARKLYDSAAQLGDPDASLAMGRSYDPSYFEQLQVKTGKPDPAQAFDWYMRALDNGVDTAKVKIDTLKQWLLR